MGCSPHWCCICSIRQPTSFPLESYEPSVCPLKETARTLWHELAPDRLVLLYSREFLHKGLTMAFLTLYAFFFPVFISRLSFSTAASGRFFSPRSSLSLTLSARHQTLPSVWRTGASNVCWSNLPQMYKTWLIKRTVKPARPIFIHHKHWQMASFFLFYLSTSCPLSAGWFHSPLHARALRKKQPLHWKVSKSK